MVNNEVIEGKLFFYSETGTEGGYWAFLDSKYLSLVPPKFGIIPGRRVWDNNTDKQGVVLDAEIFLNQEWLPLIDPIIKDPDYRISSLFCGEDKGDLSADERLQKRYNFTIKYAVQRMNEEYGVNNWKFGDRPFHFILNDGTVLAIGVTPTTIPDRPYPLNGELIRETIKWNDGTIEHQRKYDTLLVESWGYEALHILENGDYLKILNPTDQSVVWSGKIDLIPYATFTKCANGWWIKADQKGISREEWSKYFFDNYPAQLIVRYD